jgi:hypothetical protein
MAVERWLQVASAVVAAMPAPQRQGEEREEARRTRFQEAEAAKAAVAAMPGTPRWVAVQGAVMRWSFRVASAARGEVAVAMRLPRYREAATVVGRSRPCPVGSGGTAAATGPLLAAQFPCRCSR